MAKYDEIEINGINQRNHVLKLIANELAESNRLKRMDLQLKGIKTEDMA